MYFYITCFQILYRITYIVILVIKYHMIIISVFQLIGIDYIFILV